MGLIPPTPVYVIRPKATWRRFAHLMLTAAIGYALAAGVIMLLLPATLLDIAPGYVEVLASVVAARWVLSGAGYLGWTFEHDEVK